MNAAKSSISSSCLSNTVQSSGAVMSWLVVWPSAAATVPFSGLGICLAGSEGYGAYCWAPGVGGVLTPPLPLIVVIPGLRGIAVGGSDSPRADPATDNAAGGGAGPWTGDGPC